MGKYRPESIEEATNSVTAGEIEGYDFLSPGPEPPAPAKQPTRTTPKARLGRPAQASKADDEPAETKLTVFVETDIKIAVEHLGSDLRKPDKQIVNGALKYIIQQYAEGKIDRGIFD